MPRDLKGSPGPAGLLGGWNGCSLQTGEAGIAAWNAHEPGPLGPPFIPHPFSGGVGAWALKSMRQAQLLARTGGRLRPCLTARRQLGAVTDIAGDHEETLSFRVPGCRPAWQVT